MNKSVASNSTAAKKRNPEAVKANILRVATEEFATSGYAGARVNVIAEKTDTSKRMIYYYFGDKQELYRTVLEAAYRDIRLGEQQLHLNDLNPEQALRSLVAFTFEHQRNNPQFIRLVMIENIHEGRNLIAKEAFEEVNNPAIDRLGEIYNRGVEEGVFRSGISVIELHWLISSACFFNNSNRSTFSAAFGNDLFTEEGQRHLNQQVQEMILRFVAS